MATDKSPKIPSDKEVAMVSHANNNQVISNRDLVDPHPSRKRLSAEQITSCALYHERIDDRVLSATGYPKVIENGTFKLGPVENKEEGIYNTFGDFARGLVTTTTVSEYYSRRGYPLAVLAAMGQTDFMIELGRYLIGHEHLKKSFLEDGYTPEQFDKTDKRERHKIVAEQILKHVSRKEAMKKAKDIMPEYEKYLFSNEPVNGEIPKEESLYHITYALTVSDTDKNGISGYSKELFEEIRNKYAHEFEDLRRIATTLNEEERSAIVDDGFGNDVEDRFTIGENDQGINPNRQISEVWALAAAAIADANGNLDRVFPEEKIGEQPILPYPDKNKNNHTILTKRSTGSR